MASSNLKRFDAGGGESLSNDIFSDAPMKHTFIYTIL